MWAETAPKLLLVAWAVVVILAQSFFASPGWPALHWLLPFVLIATSLLAWNDRRVVALIGGTAYLFPVLVFWRVGAYTAQYSAIWLAATLGVLIPDALRRSGWHLSGTLRQPLIAWAAAVAFAVPIIVLRESDRLNTTIRSFLEYARPQRYAVARVDVRRVVNDTALLLRNGASILEGHAIEVDVPSEEVWYDADENQIRQIV